MWFLTPERDELHCAAMFDSLKNEHDAGAVLALGELPNYHAALVSRTRDHGQRRAQRTGDARAREGLPDPEGITR